MEHSLIISSAKCLNQLLTLHQVFLLTNIFDHQQYFTMLSDFILKEPPVTYIKLTQNDIQYIDPKLYRRNSNIKSDINIYLTQDPNIKYNIMHDVNQYAKTSHVP